MSEEEVASFLAEQKVTACATNGRSGWPHVMPLWYVLRGGRVWGWTYAKSQKARNLERDGRATLSLETGDRYEELRGVMIESRVAIHRELETVIEVGREILERYGGGALGEGFMEVVRAQAAKRVALEFAPVRTVSWDHRKLGGGY